MSVRVDAWQRGMAESADAIKPVRRYSTDAILVVSALMSLFFVLKVYRLHKALHLIQPPLYKFYIMVFSFPLQHVQSQPFSLIIWANSMIYLPSLYF